MLDALTTLLPPPASLPAPALAWDALSEHVGLAVPEDVRAFLDRYGGGTINGALTVSDPRRGDLVTATNALGAMAAHRALGRASRTGDLAFFPEPGGMFPFGETSGRGSLWAGGGRVALFTAEEKKHFVFDGALPQFLARALTEDGFTKVLKLKKPRNTFKPFERKQVVHVACSGATSDVRAYRAPLEALMGKVKVLAERSESFELSSPRVTISVAVEDGGRLALGFIYLADDEAAVRALAARFIAERSLAVISIRDFAGNAAWEDVPADASADVERLVACVPSPNGAARVPDWAVSERLLGTKVPSDLRAIGARYGIGAFGGLRLWGPSDVGRAWFRHLPRLHALRPKLALAPFIKSGATDGALPIAEGHGGLLCWWTGGAPRDWRTVWIADLEGDAVAHPFAGGLAAFLAAASSGELPFLRLAPTFEAAPT